MGKLDVDELENIEDAIPAIEKMFQIKFHVEDYKGLSTFSDLCDLIISKIELPHLDSCTSQQAFYKVRQAIYSLGLHEVGQLNIDSKLSEIFPSNGRTMSRFAKCSNGA